MPPRRPPRAGSLRDLAPWKILKQMVILQVAYYACATILLLFTTAVAGAPFSLDLVFSWRSVRGDTTMGWLYGFVWLLNDLPSITFILLFVARSKLVPDFALTIHLVHTVVVSLYARAPPAHWLWWGTMLASSLLMIVAGVWACQWRELRPISIGGQQGKAEGEGGRREDEQAQEDGEGESLAFGRGRGRERSTAEEGFEMGPVRGGQRVEGETA